MIYSTSLLTETGIGQVVNVRIVWAVLIADQCDSMEYVEIDTRTPRWTVFVSPVAVGLFFSLFVGLHKLFILLHACPWLGVAMCQPIRQLS